MIAIIVRIDNRGLSRQTLSLANHLGITRRLAITGLPGSPDDPSHLTPHTFEIPRSRMNDRALVSKALDQVSSLVTCETFYSDEIIRQAKAKDIELILIPNREFLHPDEMEAAAKIIWPSDWMLPQRWQDRSQVLPFPVDRAEFPPATFEGIEYLVHSAGHGTQGDRHSTLATLEAARKAQVKLAVHSVTKKGLHGSSAGVALVDGFLSHPRDIYSLGEALVIPRRWGGLSLPIQEAASLSMPLIMMSTDPYAIHTPSDLWVAPASYAPIKGILATDLSVATADTHDLARAMHTLVHDPLLASQASEMSDALAQSISWEALGEKWRQALGIEVAQEIGSRP